MDDVTATLECDSPPAPSQRKKRFVLYVTLLAAANFVWAGQLVVIKYIEPFLKPLTMALVPFLIVTPLMLPLLFVWRTSPRVRPTAADWGRFFVAGAVGQIICQIGMTWAAAINLVSNCSIIYLLVPVITAVMASLMLREKLTPLRIVCLVIGLAGVLLMSRQAVQESSFLTSKYFKGNLLMLLGCVGASFFNVYCKGLMQRFNDRDILIYSYIAACATALPVLFWLHPDWIGQMKGMDTRGWWAMLFNALLVYGLSMIVFFYVLQHLPVTVALSSVYLLPVFGLLLAMILLHERPSGAAIVGGVVVLVSTMLIMKYDPSVS